MKLLVATLSLALSLTAIAEEKKAIAYTVGMTGVTWAGCKKDVSSAFKKLTGVSKVEITAGDKAGTQKVTVLSSSGDLTKEQAIKSLGKKASTYKVHTFAKADAAGTETYTVAMTGVTWAGCKKDVSSAFKKLAGVSKIEITAGDKPGTQKVTVVSTSGDLTKEQAIKALGKKAETYVVKSFEKAKS